MIPPRMVCALALGAWIATAAAGQSPRTMVMVEALRIGGADDGPASFARIFAVTAAANGNIFVVDGPPIQLKLFDARGRFLRNVGRSGGGPGEYAFVSALRTGPDGHVHVIDVYGMRQLVFSADGELVRQQGIQFGVLTREWQGTIARDGGLLDPVRMAPRESEPGGSERRSGVRRIRADGAVLDTLPLPPCRSRQGVPPSITFSRGGQLGMVLRMPFLAPPQMVYTADGHAWCAPRDVYFVARFRAGSLDTLVTVERQVRARAISRDTLRKTIQGIEAAARRYGESSFRAGDLPSTLPVIEAVAVDDQGRLWIRRTDTPARAPQFDLFDTDGRELGTVRSRVPFIGVPIVVGDLAYGIVRDADDVPFVVRARLTF
jgi:hypothetical protein